MEKEFVPYELAVKLKELGFDKDCLGVYYNKDGNVRFNLGTEKGDAPLWQQAFDWFRDKGLHSWIYKSNIYSFHYTILKDGRYAKNGSDTIHYQEARQACLKKLIELISK